jgi:hypothetical protein
MTENSRIRLSPVDGGESHPIPQEKTTIGRGTFLQVCQCPFLSSLKNTFSYAGDTLSIFIKLQNLNVFLYHACMILKA